ncbi:hypothetical protein PybrP1_007330 [[Pythium] brassicae (nom. inval.)]|nr:hypothetical protein PybrP1_007330 [[Pythium] brassicae (nom. inval.)]
MTRNWRMTTALRLAGGTAVLLLYCAPLVLRNGDAAVAHSGAQVRDVLFLRMWLAFALTLAALCGVVSKPVVLASSLHALLHFARTLSDAPPLVAPPGSPLLAVLQYWQHNSIESCVYEYGTLLSFALLLRYVLFPPTSALGSFERHSRNLKKFFAVHDSQFVPLVDRLLEEYTGHERLLYARIRRLYCPNGTDKRTSHPSTNGVSSPLETA